MKSVFRIRGIKLHNFKNVEDGEVYFSTKNEETDGDVLGIYGQNGSGKTALSDACQFFKSIVSGESLRNDAYYYIYKFSNEATLCFDFSMETTKKYFVTYQVSLKKDEESKKAIILQEKLSYSTVGKSKISMTYSSVSEELIKPLKLYQNIIDGDFEKEVKLKVAKQLAIEKGTSFIFNEYTKPILFKGIQESDWKTIIEGLIDYSRFNLFVINNYQTGIINANVFFPFSFRIEDEASVTSGELPIFINEPTLVKKESYEIINKITQQMNVVLNTIVPSLKLELYNYGEQFGPDGSMLTKIELLSLKDNLKMPLRYESDGIKKIISILSALIAMYNNPSVCIVIDELDSGIYEFLLGEILKVIQEGGKGQLIFTSHNLRALEVINKDCLYFTTTNSKNRYVHFSNVKPNNSLRSLYIRSINIGGQKECLYNETNEAEIRRAFRLAGETVGK